MRCIKNLLSGLTKSLQQAGSSWTAMEMTEGELPSLILLYADEVSGVLFGGIEDPLVWQKVNE